MCCDPCFQCGRSFDPRFLFCWPNAKIGMEDPKHICDTLLQVSTRLYERFGILR